MKAVIGKSCCRLASSDRLGFSLLAGAALFAFGSRLEADFLEPQKISDGERRVLQVEVGADLSYNAYVLWTEGFEMNLKIINSQSTSHIALSAPDSRTGDPALATNTVGTTFIFFTEDHPELGGRQIMTTSNPGGVFSLPARMVSRGPSDNRSPRISLGPGDQPYVTWAQQYGNTMRVMYLPPGGTASPMVTDADFPAIAVDSQSTVHIVYTRSRDLFVINSRNGTALGPPAAVTRTPFDMEFYSSIAVSESGPGSVPRVFVAYERVGSLYYQESADGGNRFGPPHILDSGGIATPNLRVTPQPDGSPLLSIVYTKEGKNFYTFGKVGGALTVPAPVVIAAEGGTTPEIESNPSLAIDTRGVLHVAFLRGSQAWYTNNGGGLTAQFSSDRTEGELPLEIHFSDLSSGFVDYYHWDFGDGSTSEERNPVHTYLNPGRYTVSLDIRGTGTDASVRKVGYISVQSPNNKIWMPDQTCLPGQRDIYFPVNALHKNPLQGFEFVGTHDPQELILKEITYRGTALDSLEVEFFSPSFSNGLSDAYFYAGVIFDWDEPWDNQTLPPPLNYHRILYLIFDCIEDATQGGTTLVEPRNNVGPGGTLHNVFAVTGSPKNSVLPVLEPSTVTILEVDFPNLPQVFIRGDVDWSIEVDLSDAVSILSFLFLGKEQPTCQDAADVDDSGTLDIADSINLLTFLFLGGNAPPVPFPTAGLDAVNDDLPRCKR